MLKIGKTFKFWGADNDRDENGFRTAYLACVKCGATKNKHVGKGVCSKCHNKEWVKNNPERRRAIALKSFKKRNAKKV